MNLRVRQRILELADVFLCLGRCVGFPSCEVTKLLFNVVFELPHARNCGRCAPDKVPGGMGTNDVECVLEHHSSGGSLMLSIDMT